MAMKGLNISGTEETIGKLAQRIVQGNLSEMEVKAKCKVLVESASNPNTTRLANDDQKEKCLLRKNKGIDYPDYFVLESVKERLDGYDISSKPGLQALSDVMIMLCIRPAEVKSLRISDGRVTGYVKHRDQVDIPRAFKSMEKNEERARQLLKWIQDAISSGQLKIRIPVNYRPRGVPYDQAKPFKLQTPTKTNHMAAHPGKSAEDLKKCLSIVNYIWKGISTTPFGMGDDFFDLSSPSRGPVDHQLGRILLNHELYDRMNVRKTNRICYQEKLLGYKKVAEGIYKRCECPQVI
ncbi:hypothetical protein RhiirA5_377589 [Rhizophagus irregularis]|uniref:Uncharacterized protein n=1 Tax=Rhizophagus irregularis TaxID=588596 RepID=A0A2N0PIU3_9GLOM|nr:hypothetical protein RhiirA5_377589 [Rhizophagus irregularis]